MAKFLGRVTVEIEADDLACAAKMLKKASETLRYQGLVPYFRITPKEVEVREDERDGRNVSQMLLSGLLCALLY